MSVLIYRDKHTASVAAATLLAASIISDPSCTIGLDYAAGLDSVYDSLSAMTANGLLNWNDIKVFQLTEVSDESSDPLPIFRRLGEVLMSETEVLDDHYFLPIVSGESVEDSCRGFDSELKRAGGLDVALIAIRKDGGLLYYPSERSAPSATAEHPCAEGTAACVGLSGLMNAKKLIAVALGEEFQSAADLAVNCAITGEYAATLLKLHNNITFIFDEDAAQLL